MPRARAVGRNYWQPWDSEAANFPDGSHRLILIGDGDNNLKSRDGIDGWDALKHLFNHAERGRQQVMFAGSYDVTMMLKDTPQDVIETVVNGDTAVYDGLTISMIPRKMLILKERGKGGRKVKLQDVFSFFGTSFVGACKEWIGDSETLRIIADMKDQRSLFDPSQLPNIEKYMNHELDLLVELMESLRDKLAFAGLRPRSWHGPGAVANSLLSREGVKAHLSETSTGHSIGARAYFGGRFEPFQIGTHTGKVYGYDIRSAYPHALRNLPSLGKDPQWKRTVNDDRFGFHVVRYEGVGRLPHAIPYRSSDGAVCWPNQALTCVWDDEYRVLQRLYPGTYTHVETWTLADWGWRRKARPFAFVETLYNERNRLKSEGHPAQLAYKLALNSVYGKLCQTVGAEHIPSESAWHIPQWAQPEYASMITSNCRARILEAAHQAGSATIAIETDGIYTTKKLDLPLSTNLGDWEETEYDGIMYLQSGYYATLKDNVWTAKTRGTEMCPHLKNGVQYPGCNKCARSVTPEMLSEHLSQIKSVHSQSTAEPITITVNRFVAITSRRWDHIGEWEDREQQYVAGSGRKRRHQTCPQCGKHSMAKKLHELSVPPVLGSLVEESYPHPVPWVAEPEKYLRRGYRQYAKKVPNEAPEIRQDSTDTTTRRVGPVRPPAAERHPRKAG